MQHHAGGHVEADPVADQPGGVLEVVVPEEVVGDRQPALADHAGVAHDRDERRRPDRDRARAAAAAATSARLAPGLLARACSSGGRDRRSTPPCWRVRRAAGPPGRRTRCQTRTSSRAASGVGMVSSSSSQTRSGSWVSARSMPTANPPAPPVFVARRTTSRSVRARRAARRCRRWRRCRPPRPASSAWVCARSAASASASSSRRFQVTTTATTRVGRSRSRGTPEPYCRSRSTAAGSTTARRAVLDAPVRRCSTTGQQTEERSEDWLAA